jgi:hypothetical protein
MTIPFPSPDLALIAKQVLEVDKELKPELSQKLFTVKESNLVM